MTIFEYKVEEKCPNCTYSGYKYTHSSLFPTPKECPRCNIFLRRKKVREDCRHVLTPEVPYKYTLMLREALVAMVTDGAVVEESNSFFKKRFRFSDSRFEFKSESGWTLAVMDWGKSSMYRIVKKKYRLMTMREILEKFPDYYYDEDGDLLFNEESDTISCAEFQLLGTSDSGTHYPSSILVEID